jgi:hypothetical protein
VWLVLELCTGGTLKDAVSMGKLKAQGRLEMVNQLDVASDSRALHVELVGICCSCAASCASSPHGNLLAAGHASKLSSSRLLAINLQGVFC